MTKKEFIASLVCEKRYIDAFLDDSAPNWATFNNETGYLLKSSIMRDGVDDSYTISRFENGIRKQINYAGDTCRIATYGDSFTQCHQVSDGETWQEYLAAHLCEPIKNYGIGGHGVFQAYKRMLQYENNPETECENIVLNIFSDDHFRNIDSWRWLRIEGFRNEIKDVNVNYFHANPWAHLRIDNSGKFVECPSFCPTKESLYNLCDFDFLYEQLKNDIIVDLFLAQNNGEFNKNNLNKLSEVLEFSVDYNDIQNSAELLHNLYALKSTEFVTDKVIEYAKARGKKLLIMLSYGTFELRREFKSGVRFDKQYLDYLNGKGLNYVDLWQCHYEDFKKHNITFDEYLEKYYILGFGHYNPTGNHYCAFEAKDKLVEMLDPKPVVYRTKDKDKEAAMLASRLA